MSVAIVAWALACMPSGVHAEVRPAGIFTDHMVLQRDIPMPVWGTAAAGEEVAVEFGAQAKTARSNEQGQWRVVLDPVPVSTEPRSLVIRGSHEEKKFSDVLVGEVWFCSGQSNMEILLPGTGRAAEEQALPANPLLRAFSHRKLHGNAPLTEIENGRWWKADPKTVSAFYATAYYFGRRLQQELGVPVGLVQSAWGGTPVQAWMSRDMLSATPEMRAVLERGVRDAEEGKAANAKHLAAGGDPKKPPWPEWKFAHMPTYEFNGMVHPFVPYAIRGVIWYQGEHNVAEPDLYGTLFPAMIRGWRDVWGQGEFPFLFVQLPGLRLHHQMQGNLVRLRAMQAKALALPNTGMAVIHDTAEEEDNHPRNKRPAGERLAAVALAKTYGRDVAWSGPTLKGMEVEGGQARVLFDHVEGGLVATDLPAEYRPVSTKPETKPLVRKAPGGPLEGFEVRGDDGRWHWADARIDGDTVIVSSQRVSKPVAVRYGQADFGFFNLCNAAGLPAPPFVTSVTGAAEASIKVMLLGDNGHHKPAAFKADEHVIYKKADGRDLSLYVYKPTGWREGSRLPALVYMHGGGWAGGTLHQGMDLLDTVRDNGMVGINVEYRLADEKNLDPARCIEDAKSALRFVRSQAEALGIDPERIVAGGHSAGGHLAAACALLPTFDAVSDDLRVSCKPNALALIVPVLDNGPDQGYKHSAPAIQADLRAYSPAQRVVVGAPPTIIFAGKQDTGAALSCLRRFTDNMKQAGNECQLFVYEGGHGFANNNPVKDEVNGRIVAFVRQLGWLPDSRPVSRQELTR